MAEPAAFRVGQRVRAADNLALGSVRYLGPVEGQKGEWIGVEWDDPTRGKHDGSHAGVRYFSCVTTDVEARATACSFVKASKLKTRVDFLEAVRWRYTTDGDACSTGAENMYVHSASGHKVAVEMVGLGVGDKLRKHQEDLSRLPAVYVNDACVDTVGRPGEAAAAMPAVEELDISGNTVATWEALAAFGVEFPTLRVLDASRLPLPSSPPSPLHFPFAQLRTLVLSGTGLRWCGALRLHTALTQLTELHLCHNGIDRVDPAAEDGTSTAVCFAKLEKLNLEDNALASWGEVQALGQLPALACLMLSNNQLPSVAAPAAGTFRFALTLCREVILDPTPNQTKWWAYAACRGHTGALQTLTLGGNRLDSWAAVDTLDRFPALADVRLTGNPLQETVAGGAAAMRLEVVARMGGLRHLNGSAVGPGERRDAEIRYLRRVLDAQRRAAEATGEGEEAATAAAAQVAAEHPRAAALEATYGTLTTGAGGAGGPVDAPTSLGEEMVQLTLRCVAASAGERSEATKRLPGSLTVVQLKALCESLFKVAATDQQLFTLTPGCPLPEPLGDGADRETLSYLGVAQGATVLVGMRDE